MVKKISAESLGLCEIADAAIRLGAAERTVQKWVFDGLIPALPVGKGRRLAYLVRLADVDAFRRPTMGRPKRKKPATRKPRAKKT